jgi:hypothetical protein
MRRKAIKSQENGTKVRCGWLKTPHDCRKCRFQEVPCSADAVSCARSSRCTVRRTRIANATSATVRRHVEPVRCSRIGRIDVARPRSDGGSGWRVGRVLRDRAG